MILSCATVTTCNNQNFEGSWDGRAALDIFPPRETQPTDREPRRVSTRSSIVNFHQRTAFLGAQAAVSKRTYDDQFRVKERPCHTIVSTFTAISMMSLSGITTYTKAAKSRNGTNPSTSTFKSRNKVDISFSTSGKSKECYESDALLRHPTTTASSIKSNHTAVEIWQWTLTHDAIAPCFIKDIFRLQECDSKGVYVI